MNGKKQRRLCYGCSTLTLPSMMITGLSISLFLSIHLRRNPAQLPRTALMSSCSMCIDWSAEWNASGQVVTITRGVERGNKSQGIVVGQVAGGMHSSLVTAYGLIKSSSKYITSDTLPTTVASSKVKRLPTLELMITSGADYNRKQ